MNKVVLFGVCEAGLHVKENMKVEDGVEIVFCDNDVNKQGEEYYGITVVEPECIFRWYCSNLLNKVIIVSRAVKQIFEQCILGNISEEKIFYWDYESNILRKGTEWFAESVFSQDGEEIYLKALFANKEKGFYVDIGANHPLRFSNTRWAYERGWNGINIEPDEQCYELLKRMRTRDINLNVGISQADEDKEFYSFSESALNTFDKQEAKKVSALNIYGNYEVTKCQCRRLETIFEEHQTQKIDFMDIDVEGMELAVLQSINWEKVNIDVILIEQKNLSIDEIIEMDIYKFLIDKGYKVQAKFNRTTFYERGSIACL